MGSVCETTTRMTVGSLNDGRVDKRFQDHELWETDNKDGESEGIETPKHVRDETPRYPSSSLLPTGSTRNVLHTSYSRMGTETRGRSLPRYLDTSSKRGCTVHVLLVNNSTYIRT